MFVQRLNIAPDRLALLSRTLVLANLIAGGQKGLEARQRCEAHADLRDQPVIGGDVGQTIFEITRRLAFGASLTAENVGGEIIDAGDRIFENLRRAVNDGFQQLQKQRRAAAHPRGGTRVMAAMKRWKDFGSA